MSKERIKGREDENVGKAGRNGVFLTQNLLIQIETMKSEVWNLEAFKLEEKEESRIG